MGRDYDFPFTIADVCGLLDLRVRRKLQNSMYVDCPFCANGKKGKMNINFAKDTFRCNYNDEHAGGMIELYARYRGINRSDAYREICDALRVGRASPAEFGGKKVTPPPLVDTVDIVDLETRHQTYSMLFAGLILTPTHKKELLRRGLTEEQIEKNGYRSTPAFGFTQTADRLLKQGCTLKGVPGFFQTKTGEWTMNFNAKCSGILIPVKSIDGRIQGAQIRMDHPFEDAKYIWFSSPDKLKGCSSGSPVHFVGDPQCETVFVTEGPLKGDVAHALSGKSFLCIAGVGQTKELGPALKILKGIALKKVVEAHDMDKRLPLICQWDCGEKCATCEYRESYRDLSNCPRKERKREAIRRGCSKLLEICRDLELLAVRLTWDKKPDGDWAGNWKGIDDYQFAAKRRDGTQPQ